jgi:hypothetical protein
MKAYTFLASFGGKRHEKRSQKSSMIECLFFIVIGRVFCETGVYRYHPSEYSVKNTILDLRDTSLGNRGNLSNWEG